MRRVPPDEAKQMLRAHAQERAALLVPRPGYPIYGLTAPALGPARVTQYSSSSDQWTSVTLSYGTLDAQDGPRVTVTTTARGGDDLVSRPATERQPDAVSRRDVESVTVTVEAWGVDIDTVRAGPVPDLRPLIEAAAEETIARIERLRSEPRPAPPPLDLPPAEGVAALRALVDLSLATHREILASVRARRAPGRGPGWGRLHDALWQRAVRERQRLGGVGAEAADADVTSAVNQLGHLLEHAPWFEADARLREAATDETLRHAMLGEAVPSLPAQRAWAAYWTAHLSGAGRAATDQASGDWLSARQALIGDWLTAWTAWTATA